ncbi:MAG: SDR family NAD(P)-dependent oxidoreductase [Proteobacteria bacterium]|nr:SDR family NAD(P)-dependent oxidoreductase [Pseudomonadota bacterium]
MTTPACVWITGASSGLGRAVALRYAGAGAMVAASARSAEAMATLAAAPAAAGRIHAFPVDVTDRVAMVDTVARIEAALGPIELAILNAGTHEPVDAQHFDAAVFDRLFAVNLTGTVNGLHAILPRLIARRTGQVALVASVAGYGGLPTAAAYGATKAAMINLAEALKFDLDPLGVRLSLVNPGFVRTPLTDQNPFPMPALMEVDDAARALVRGLARGGFEVTFPRRFTYVVKLLRLLPYRLYFPLVARLTGK